MRSKSLLGSDGVDERHPVDVIWERGEPSAFDVALGALAATVLAGEGAPQGRPVIIVITGDEAVQALNREFLGIDEPTDVLSFPYEGSEVFPMPDEQPFGELFVALPTVERQAREYGLPVAKELAHVVVHGILHLCGYDHAVSAEEEARMRAREEAYLGDLGPAHAHRAT